jgi:hypothetical protein
MRVPQNLLAEHFMLDAAPALPPRWLSVVHLRRVQFNCDE